jgi:flagellin-like protein
MSTKNLLKSKKAITPILATLLLIVIAVAAIVVTYAWVMTYMSSAGQQAGVMLDIENVNWNSATNNTTIVVKNTGTSDTKIVRLYIGNTSDNLIDVTANASLGTGVNLPAGSKIDVVLSWPNGLADMWTSNKYYYFKVVPETGVPKEFTSKSPA